MQAGTVKVQATGIPCSQRHAHLVIAISITSMAYVPEKIAHSSTSAKETVKEKVKAGREKAKAKARVKVKAKEMVKEKVKAEKEPEHPEEKVRVKER